MNAQMPPAATPFAKPLVNEIAPVSVLLTNDGSHLVTFDNWHAAGYGDNVVVIYDRRRRRIAEAGRNRAAAAHEARPPEVQRNRL